MTESDMNYLVRKKLKIGSVIKTHKLDFREGHEYEVKLVMNYHHRQYRKWFQQYQSGIVRHVHGATTPSGKALRHT